MPAEQRGSVYRTSRGFGVRYYDEMGARRRQAGFSSPSKARAWFRDVELLRMRGGLVNEPLTLREFSDRCLARYEADRAAVTVQTLRWRLVRPLDEFGDVKLSALRAGEIAAWEATLPPRFRYAVVRALRQVLDAAVAWEYLARNPAKATGKNPAPTVVERIALVPADVDRLAGELRSPYDVAIVVGAWTYLRPSEFLALERADVDGDVLHVRRTLDGEGGTKIQGKTRRSLRTVPAAAQGASGARGATAATRHPAPVPRAVGSALRPPQLRPARVRVGERGGRAPRRRHAVHASPLGDLVGARRWHPAEQRRTVRGNERHHARTRLRAPARVERGRCEGAAGRVRADPFGGRRWMRSGGDSPLTEATATCHSHLMSATVDSLLDEYQQRYSERDAEGVTDLCLWPFLAIRRGEAIHLLDRDAVRNHFAAAVQAYRFTGVASWRRVETEVRQLGEYSVFMTVNWNTIDAEGKVLRDSWTSYQMLATSDGWRFLSYTNHF